MTIFRKLIQGLIGVSVVLVVGVLLVRVTGISHQSLSLILPGKEPEYTVSFRDNNGTVLEETTVSRLESATPPEVPDTEDQIFIGWDSRDFRYVTQDVVVTAVVIDTKKDEENGASRTQFLVRFLDWDGSFLAEESTWGCGYVEAPDPPNRKGYRFLGWDSEAYRHVHQDLVITALYEELP